MIPASKVARSKSWVHGVGSKVMDPVPGSLDRINKIFIF